MKLEQRIQAYISNQQMLADTDRVLVALSGGADSVALLRILLRLGYHCHAVHCNFHLRGAESDRDEQFVSDLCSRLCVPCEVIHFDTREYAECHHLSIEMAARELRYREFERIREEHHLQAIAVAHHQDDAVETLLLNLVRGAGINGLTGMRSRNGHVVRPLLCVTRDEIVGYLNHLEQVELQLTREPRPLPKMKINPDVKDIFDFKYEDFELVDYDPHPHIKGVVAV